MLTLILNSFFVLRIIYQVVAYSKSYPVVSYAGLIEQKGTPVNLSYNITWSLHALHNLLHVVVGSLNP